MNALFALILLLGTLPAPVLARQCTVDWPLKTSPSAEETCRCRDWWLEVATGLPATEELSERQPTGGEPEARGLTTAALKQAAAHVRALCGERCAGKNKYVLMYFDAEIESRTSLMDFCLVNLTPYLQRALAGQSVLEGPVGDNDPLMRGCMDTPRRLRNAVYARHGRPFQSADLDEFFYSLPRGKAWTAAGLPVIEPDSNYSDDRLTPQDKANVAALNALERRLGEQRARESRRSGRW